MELIRIGVAGWDYPDWAGIVYPSPFPGTFNRLSFVASFFDLVEINVTFYRQPDPGTVRSWINHVSSMSSFRFTAKLCQTLTHMGPSAPVRRKRPSNSVTTRTESIAPAPPDEADLRSQARAYRTGIDPLLKSGRLGAVLMQFPQSFHDRPDSRTHLQTLAELLPGLSLIAEFRHRSWDNEGALGFLRDLGVGFCNIDQPSLGATLPPTAHLTSSVGYVRLHGRNAASWFARKETGETAGRGSRPGSARYDYFYSLEELRPWGERARSLAERAEEVFVVANNHYRGKGPANALMLKSALEGRRVRAPADLVSAFPELKDCAEPVPSGKAAPAQGRLF